MDLHIDRIQHHLDLPLSADTFVHGATWEDLTTAARADGGDSPTLDGPTNAEPYFVDWEHDDTESLRTRTILQLQDYYQFVPENAQTTRLDHHGLPLGSDIPVWEDALSRSKILSGSYEAHAEHSRRLDVIDADFSNVATSDHQAPWITRDNPFHISGAPCRGNSTHQVIQTCDNSTVKPGLDNHDGHPESIGCTEEQENEQLGPFPLAPFSSTEYSPRSAYTWQTDMASASDAMIGIAPDHCPQDTAWTHADPDISTIGNDATTSWNHLEDPLWPFSSSFLEEQKAAGLWDGGPLHEAFNYFDGS